MKVMDSFRLDGQVAFVTGGARTLGYDMAEALAEAGCHLAITSREEAHAERAAQKLKDAYGVDVLPLASLVKSQVRALARELDVPAPVIDKAPSSKKALASVQAAFNTWRADSGRSLAEISRTLACTVG